ncbi:MAG TPA: hypothetical protein VKV04_05920 [Verrucomicrobiae bacterium]|nr:hypothetical protein [Verrucomicrobiae bacterium]
MKKAKRKSTGKSKARIKAQKLRAPNRTSVTRAPACKLQTTQAGTDLPPRKRIPRPAALPRISSYAISLLDRKSADATQPTPDDLPDQPIPKSWLTTRQASRRSGYSIRHIQNLCDQGFFLEGEDWKQRPSRPGISRRGHIYINPAAIKKLDWAAG